MGFMNDDSPTDGWDDWGETIDVAPQLSNTEDLSFLDSENENNEESKDDWDDWDNSQQSSDAQSGGFINQEEDDWDDWNNTTEQNNESNVQSGGFINQSNTQESWNDWNENQTSVNNSPVQEVTKYNFNFSSKKIAVILAGVLIVVAIIFMGIDKIHIGRKPAKENQQVTQEQNNQVNQEQNNQVQQEPQNNTPNTDSSQQKGNVNSVVLVEVPVNTPLNYSGDVLDANGTISSKTKYVQGHQVLYCITINVVFGSSSESINYYCNYASYNAVSVEDIVVVSYQQVEDNYISVNAISK